MLHSFSCPLSQAADSVCVTCYAYSLIQILFANNSCVKHSPQILHKKHVYNYTPDSLTQYWENDSKHTHIQTDRLTHTVLGEQ